jgi:hypothetical protein
MVLAAGGTEEFLQAGALVEELQEQPEHAVERLAAEVFDAGGALFRVHGCGGGRRVRRSGRAELVEAIATSDSLRKARSCW